MYTSQLKRALERNRDTRHLWRNVVASDMLPRRIPKRPGIIIANTDPSTRPGQHWVAYYFTDSCVTYFDSYGRAPASKMMRLRKNQRYFGRRIQGTGNMCGEYCLYFVLTMIYNLNFDCFGTDLEANDRLVKRLVKRYFDV